MPEYLRKKVELLKTDNDVWVLELHTEFAYRVQRDKIQNLLNERLIAVNSNYEKLWSLIQQIQPDIIHFEELSDYHVPYEGRGTSRQFECTKSITPDVVFEKIGELTSENITLEGV